MQLDTVIFDIDGLLVDSEPLWNDAAAEVFKLYGVNLTEEQYKSTTGLRTKEFVQWWFGYFGIDMAYIAAWHQAPVREGRDLLRLHWQITSVRRAPGKLKYLAGSESAMGAFIMDMKPEQSAQQLKDVKL